MPNREQLRITSLFSDAQIVPLSNSIFANFIPDYCYPHFPCGSDGKVSVYDAGDPVSIPGLGRSVGEGNGNPLQYYCLENPMDMAWQLTPVPTVHGVAKSRTRLSIVWLVIAILIQIGSVNSDCFHTDLNILFACCYLYYPSFV